MRNYTNPKKRTGESGLVVSICWSSSEENRQFYLYRSAKTQWSLLKHFSLQSTKVHALQSTKKAARNNPDAERAVPGAFTKSSRSALLLIEFGNFHTDWIVNEAQQLVIGWLFKKNHSCRQQNLHFIQLGGESANSRTIKSIWCVSAEPCDVCEICSEPNWELLKCC